MVNKILPKDINLLLNKLIIIIRKISVNCGKKNKKLTRVSGGFGLPSIFSNIQDKNLENEINSFLQNDYTYSLAFFKNLNFDYFKNPNKFFTKENINPQNQSILHNTNIANYDTNIAKYKMIPDIDKLEINEKYDYYIYGKNLIIYKNYNGEIKYIYFNEPKIDKNIMILHLKYILLYNKIYSTYDNNNINFGEIKETVYNYINFYKKELTDINRINDDSIISFYNYVVYILYDIRKFIDKEENINIELLKYHQKKGGKTDLVILKNAAIINIGNILISISRTLKNI